MLQKLSYINLFLSIIYGLIYLKSGTFTSMTGILMIIIINWLALRSFQLDDYKWRWWHYLIGLWSLYYVSTLIYGLVNVLSAVFEFKFMSNDTAYYIGVNLMFCTLVVIQILSYLYRGYKRSDP